VQQRLAAVGLVSGGVCFGPGRSWRRSLRVAVVSFAHHLDRPAGSLGEQHRAFGDLAVDGGSCLYQPVAADRMRTVELFADELRPLNQWRNYLAHRPGYERHGAARAVADLQQLSGANPRRLPSSLSPAASVSAALWNRLGARTPCQMRPTG